MATTFLTVANDAVSTTAGAIDNTTDPVTFSVAAGQGALFPSAFPFHITIGNEILSCTSRTGDSLTCARAQQGTTIASHLSGAGVELKYTAKSISDLNTAVNAVEDGAALLAGRSGGQILIGGTGSGDALTLKPTSSAAAGANMVLDLSVHQGNQIIPQYATTLTAAQTGFSLGSGQTVAINASGGVRGLNMSGTWQINAAPNASCFIFNNFNPTVQLTATGAALKATTIFNVAGNYSITQNVALATDAGPFNGLKFAPNFSNAAAGGTQTITAVSGVDTVPTFDTGWTVTTCRGLRVRKPTGSGTITTLVGVDIEDSAARAGSNYAIRTNGLNDTIAFAGPTVIGAAPAVFSAPTTDPTLSLVRSVTITGTVADGRSAGLALNPTYDAASAQTVTRHNYLALNDPVVTGAGPAAVTDACVFRLDAALGTHKATTNTDRTGNAKSGTLKVNVNGTIYYIQLYA